MKGKGRERKKEKIVFKKVGQPADISIKITEDKRILYLPSKRT